MRSLLLKLLVGAIAIGALPAPALADEVANPGPVSFYLIGDKVPDVGSMLYIHPDNPFRLFVDESAVLSGDIDQDGNVYIPPEQIYFPEVRYETALGTIFLQFVTTSEGAYGAVIPRTGEAYLALSIRTDFRAKGLPKGCNIPSLDVFAYTESGYSQKDGTFRLDDVWLAIPRTDGCGFYGALIDGALGLPSDSGENRLTLVGGTDPVLLPGK